MKKSQAYISLALALAVFGVAGVYAQQTAKPAAAGPGAGAAATPAGGNVSVNGVTIPKQRVDLLVKSQAAQGQPESPALLAAVRDQLVMLEVVSQEARKKGLDKNPEIATRIAMGRQEILAQAYVQDYVKANPLSDADLKKEYDAVRLQLGDKEYKARHILVDKEDDAKAIIDQLAKGGDFAAIAKEKSKDTGSKDNGGDLDWNTPARFVGPFGEALKTLPKGQVTPKPVQTNFGYHVIKMEDVRDLKAPSFEETKENLRQRAQQQQIQKMVGELRAKAKVVGAN